MSFLNSSVMGELPKNSYTRNDKVFSNNADYAIELIPKNVNFFQRKKWIQDKVNLIGSDKALVFVKNSKIMWAFLKEDEKYWMPFEKSQFYLSVFDSKNDANCNKSWALSESKYESSKGKFWHSNKKSKSRSKLIIEENNGSIAYYGLVDNFLVVFTKNYDEAIFNIQKYSKNISKKFNSECDENEKSEKIEILGVGNISEYTTHVCDKVLNYDQIDARIRVKEEPIDDEDEVIYLNEDGESYDGLKESEIVQNKNIDNLFYAWFYTKKSDFSKKRIVILSTLIGGFLIFVLAGLHYQNAKNMAIEEINSTLEKLYKMGK